MSNLDDEWMDEEVNQSLLTAVLETEDEKNNQSDSDDELLALVLAQGVAETEQSSTIHSDSDDEPLAIMQQRLQDSVAESIQNAKIMEAKSKLANLLASNGLQVRPVPADGDCLLSAIILQMPELESNVTELRQKLCQHILTNSAHYSPFLPNSKDSLKDQIDLLKKKGHWNSELGDIVPTALANLLQINILIFSSDETCPITPISPVLGPVAGKDLAVARLVIPGREHYDAVTPLSLSTSTHLLLTPQQSTNASSIHASSQIPPRSPRKQAHYISPQMHEKTRKKERREDSWKRNIRKKLRLSGKQYTDSRGKNQPAKKLKPVNCNKCKFKCQRKFSEEDRECIFNEYYSIDSVERKQDYLCAHISESKVSRSTSNKKSLSRQYFLELGNRRERVCQTFLLKTLDISHKSVSQALLKKREGNLYTAKDKRGRHAPHNKTSQSTEKRIFNHINSFPKLDPHYTRKDTSRQFLSHDLNIRQMHSMYLEATPPEHHVSEKVYRKIFNTKFNLSFHVPKKDQCLTCTRYKQKEATTEEDELQFQEHQQRKTTARDEKNRDKERAKTDPTFESATFDLQAILSTPSGLVSQLYYKRKLSSYNLSFYTQSNQQGICYLWDETSGSKGSSEVATCLCLFLNTLRPPVIPVSLFSDTCGGQNKNKSVCAALLRRVNQHASLQMIDQKFFEPGHSSMESDSMHSAIETAKEKTRVHVPSQWDTVIRLSRKKKAYLVNPLGYSDFYDYKLLGENMFSANKVDQFGKKVNFRNIVWFRYLKCDPKTIFFKYKMDDDEFNSFQATKQTRKKSGVSVAKKYHCKVPISAAKKKDLLDLCRTGVVPEEFHSYYERLSTCTTKTDRLQEPDVLEESSEDEDIA